MMAVITKQEILLVIVGGIFVIETFSVIFQVGYFKITHGKRIFRMAPLHHHFELKGWAEPKVIVRFWVISILLAACHDPCATMRPISRCSDSSAAPSSSACQTSLRSARKIFAPSTLILRFSAPRISWQIPQRLRMRARISHVSIQS